jgi:hypothetical protein
LAAATPQAPQTPEGIKTQVISTRNYDQKVQDPGSSDPAGSAAARQQLEDEVRQVKKRLKDLQAQLKKIAATPDLPNLDAQQTGSQAEPSTQGIRIQDEEYDDDD